MRLVWTSPAREDRTSIREYIARDNRTAAIELDERFSQRAAQIIAHPLIGRTGRAAGTRELVIQPIYILVYDIAGDMIRVLRVLHAARQWPPDTEPRP